MKQASNLPYPIPVKIDILNVGTTNASQDQVLKYVEEVMRTTKEKIQIFTPNPEIIVYACKHPHFQTLLNQAQICLPDGVGLLLAALFLGKPLRERITGVDFMERLCHESVIQGWNVSFLGAKPGIAQKAAECLQIKYSGLKISFAVDELDNIKSQMSNTDILFVAYGHPKQEVWIADNLHDIPVRLAMGVGGAFDYISGSIQRAPFIVRALGLEWLYRLIRQPWRIKRQFALLEFIWLVITTGHSKRNRN